ncbi:retinol dehydrogenase 11-like [Hemiscyllium ocellatum]|uniref:retinol dehydrogenase 11-like n=1 Tax=Hemiscyllium ocellatum TaxID=170820 RepID=UPI002966B2FF|nr:retinol dehydrogenase 11-like [Hemiscyllium ocellatum]
MKRTVVISSSEAALSSAKVSCDCFKSALQFLTQHACVITGIAIAGATILILRNWVAGGVCRCTKRLDGKTVIITGANNGIGRETARELAKRGARVIMACRDLEKGTLVAEQLRAAMCNDNIVVYKLDLASLDSIHCFAKEVTEKETRLDILINNAGAPIGPREVTEDGFEMQIGVNHFGHFLLTILLLEQLKSCTPARVINVSSRAHRIGKIRFNDINMKECYDPLVAFCQSKLANILFTRELAQRLQGTGVTVNAVHPGLLWTDTTRNMMSHQPWWLRLLLAPFYFFLKSPRQGAQTTIHCAVDPELDTVTGQYFSDCEISEVAYYAQDECMAKSLWDLSFEMVHLETSPCTINDSLYWSMSHLIRGTNAKKSRTCVY